MPLRASVTINDGLTANTTTGSAVVPPSAAAGDVAVLVLQANLSTPAFVVPAGFSSRSGPDSNNNNLNSQLWTKTLAAADLGATLPVSCGTSSRFIGQLIVLRDVAEAALAVGPVVKTTIAAGTVMGTAVTTTGSGADVLLIEAARNGVSSTAATIPSPAGFTAVAQAATNMASPTYTIQSSILAGAAGPAGSYVAAGPVTASAVVTSTSYALAFPPATTAALDVVAGGSVRVIPVNPVQVHVGEVLTGRITATIPVTAASWSATLNDTGSVTASVAEEVVRKYDLRGLTDGNRCFLAFERDGRMKQAGPIRGRAWDYARGALNLTAVGIWGWLDKRVVVSYPLATPMQTSKFTVSGKSRGGIARALVALAVGGDFSTNVPIVLPVDESGVYSQTFPLWALSRVGDQLRQITQKSSDAPDIGFVPRRTAADARYIEWVMRVGTELAPSLQQTGDDWIFDASAPRSQVFGISTDEDGSNQAQQVWVTGNGQDESILMAWSVDATELYQGWPKTEGDEAHPTEELLSVVQDWATSLLSRVARPVQSFKATVAAEVAAEVQPGDFGRLITKGDVWLGDMDREMRVKTISGDMSDKVDLEMFPMQAFA